MDSHIDPVDVPTLYRTKAPISEELFSAVPAKDEINAADYLPLVDHLVRLQKLGLPDHVSRDDLVSAGNFALAKAINAYDPALGVPFCAFAMPRIRGALIDELRNADWVTRTSRNRIRQVELAQDELVSELGRQPTDDEIAERAEFSTGAVVSAMVDQKRSHAQSLEVMQTDSNWDLAASSLTPEEVAVHQEQIRYLYAAISALPDRTRLIIERYFFEKKTYPQISEELDIHWTRVRQIVRQALPAMREAIAQKPTGPQTGVAARRRAAYVADVQHLAQYAASAYAPPISM